MLTLLHKSTSSSPQRLTHPYLTLTITLSYNYNYKQEIRKHVNQLDQQWPSTYGFSLLFIYFNYFIQHCLSILNKINITGVNYLLSLSGNQENKSDYKGIISQQNMSKILFVTFPNTAFAGLGLNVSAFQSYCCQHIKFVHITNTQVKYRHSVK